MANPSGRKGTAGETARVTYFRSRGWHYATRIPKKGARDEGDVILDQAVPVMIESKETPKWTPAGFIKEMEDQIVNKKGTEFGFVIVKKRGTTDVGKYYALTTVDQMMSLVERVYRPSMPQQEGQGAQCGAYDAYGVCDLWWGHGDDLPHMDSTNPLAFKADPPPRKTKTFTRR